MKVLKRSRKLGTVSGVSNLYRGFVGPFLFLLDSGFVSEQNIICRVLSTASNADDKTLLFELVFILVWIGGAVIAVNG